MKQFLIDLKNLKEACYEENNNIIYLGLIVVVILLNLFFFYQNFMNYNQENDENGLIISNKWSSLGSVSDQNLDQTEVTFGITLVNKYNHSIDIETVEIVLNDSTINSHESGALIILVEKIVESDNNVLIETEFIINTKSMSKGDIVALEPLIKEVIIKSKETISLIN